MIVYQLKSPSGNSYIGQTKRSLELRFTEHLSFYRKWLESGRERKGGSTKLFYAFDKYGIDCWEISILHEANTLEELNEKEIYFINLFDTVSKGYNITLGGLGRNVENLEESHKEGISSSMLSFYGTENGLKNREEKIILTIKIEYCLKNIKIKSLKQNKKEDPLSLKLLLEDRLLKIA